MNGKSFRRRAIESSWRAVPGRLAVLRVLAALPRAFKSDTLCRIAQVGMDMTPQAGDALFETNFGANAPRVRVPGRAGSNYLFQRAAEGMHEQAAIELCARLLPDCDAFVDVGAHLGLYMWPLARHLGAERPGYYFEPNPELYDLLAENVARTGSSFRGYRAAIGDHDGIADFFVDRDDWSMSTLVEGFAPAHEHTRTQVDAIRFDTFAREVGLRNALVKADIECAEGLLLDGIEGSQGSVRYLVCEVLWQALNDGFVEAVEKRFSARALAITDRGLLSPQAFRASNDASRNWIFAIAPAPTFDDIVAETNAAVR